MFAHLADSNWVAHYVEEQGAAALLVLLFSGALFTAAGAPRQVLAFVFGFTFGGINGALLGTLATMLGCILSFYIARLTMRGSLQRRFGKRLQKFETLIIHKTWLKVLMIRLLPVGNNLLTNLAAGTTSVSALSFFSGSLIGYLPQMLIFGFAGAGVGLSDHSQLIISLGLFIISSLIGAYLYRSSLQDQVEELTKQ